MNDDVREFFEDVPERRRATVDTIRDLVLDAHPDAEETLKWGKPTYVIDGENTFYVSHHSEHVNLGFHDGASVDDQDNILEGTGKSMRHVKLREADEVASPELRALVERAGR